MIEKTISVKMHTSEDKPPIYTVIVIRQQAATFPGEQINPVPAETTLYSGISRVDAHEVKNAAEKAMFA